MLILCLPLPVRRGTFAPGPPREDWSREKRIGVLEDYVIPASIVMAGGMGGGSPPDQALMNRIFSYRFRTYFPARVYHENDPEERLSGFARDSDSHRASPFRDGRSASAFPALSHCGGPGATRRPKVFEVVPRRERGGRHVDQQTTKNNFHRVCLSSPRLMPDSTEPSERENLRFSRISQARFARTPHPLP